MFAHLCSWSVRGRAGVEAEHPAASAMNSGAYRPSLLRSKTMTVTYHVVDLDTGLCRALSVALPQRRALLASERPRLRDGLARCVEERRRRAPATARRTGPTNGTRLRARVLPMGVRQHPA